MSSDPENDYFSDGMTEEIINALAQIEGLKVTARTSSFVFKHQTQDIRKIGAALGVSLVLEGSIRKWKDKVRITAQLIKTDDGFHIWSENFDRDLSDIFQLQDEVSLLIANKIREHFGHLSIQEHLVQAPTKNIGAYELFLKGRFFHNTWTLEGFSKAIEYYQRSIKEDATFDLPYFGAGLSYSFLGSWGNMDQKEAYKAANNFFTKGNRLNKVSAYGNYCYAKHLFWGLWNHKEAYVYLMESMKVNSQDANSNEFMAEIHTALGDFPRALEFIDKSLEVNPLSPNHFYTKANIYYLQNRFKKAIIEIDKGLEVDATFSILSELKLACLILLGEYDTLVNSLKIHRNVPELFETLYQIVHNRKQLSLEEKDELQKKIKEKGSHFLLAWDFYLSIYTTTEQEAIQLLTINLSKNKGQLINFAYDPFLAQFHSHPDFKKLSNRYFSKGFPSDVDLAKNISPQVDKALLSQNQSETYAHLLLSKMEKEHYYLQPDLSLRELAEKIELHPNKLSWLLNEKLDTNFYEFINGHRLKHFQNKAIDKSNHHLSILGLAYESGFHSKSVFNDYFKKTTGLTPKAWIKQNSDT